MIPLMIQIERETRERIEKLAEKDQRSLSGMTRILLKAALETYDA